MSLAIGQTAPDFSVPDQDGTPVSLEETLEQGPVVLVFYPFTFTGVCEGELCGLRDDFSRYEAAGVQVLAISCNAKHAQKRWADEQGFGFPVLSDFWPHGAVAQAYGVFNDAVGCAMRATFVIGSDGTIVDVIETDDLGTAREASRYEAALATLAG